MLERAHIEKLLKLNGIDTDAPDQEIQSVLISARWHKDDIDTAMLVLRENTKDHKTHVDSLHKVFTSDERLRPETISALLGVDMDVSDESITARRKHARGEVTAGLILNMALVSLALSVIFVVSSMWYLQMGIFYQVLH